ncbi:MAG: sugar phosphate isomerase/epimerase [Pirellulales bacterium]|nr:sugar phosphate isomerase/epimerase [Pirellulales bacterium]
MDRSTRRDFLKYAAAGAAIGATSSFVSRAGAAEPAGMKFAICNETFQDWPFDKAFALAAECGYTGLEIAPFTIANDVTDIPAAKRTEIRRLAERNGLSVLGLHWVLAKTEGFHVTSPDPEVRRKTVGYLNELTRFCGDLGGNLIIFGSPKQRNLLPGVSRVEGMKYAAEVFRAAMPEMEKAGTTLALEPLTSKETNFLLTAAEGVELAKMVDSPHCKLHLDCKAMSSESEPIPDLIRKWKDWMVHFHANDPNLKGPGFGELDFVPIFKALREVGYRGWVSVEVFDYTPGPERLARESIAYMRKCLAASA